MTRPAPHVSRLVPPGPTVRAHPGGVDDATPDATIDATIEVTVDGDPEALGRLLAAVEPLRGDPSAVIVTDADAEVVRFLAVLAVLEGRADMPDHDLGDPSLKWHAAPGVRAVPNAPTIVTGPVAGGAAAVGGAA